MKSPCIASHSSHHPDNRMKLPSLCLFGLLLLTGCDSFDSIRLFHHDEVSPEARAAPRLVPSAPPSTDETPWPRLGDVPFKPQDFSTKPVYEQDMIDLAAERDAAAEAKKRVQGEAPIPTSQ